MTQSGFTIVFSGATFSPDNLDSCESLLSDPQVVVYRIGENRPNGELYNESGIEVREIQQGGYPLDLVHEALSLIFRFRTELQRVAYAQGVNVRRLNFFGDLSFRQLDFSVVDIAIIHALSLEISITPIT